MLMLATGKLYPAEHALRIGLVNSLHEPAELDAAVDTLVSTIAQKPSSVLRRGKHSFNRQFGLALPEAYAAAKEEALANITAADAKEGILAFLEKREANWVE